MSTHTPGPWRVSECQLGKKLLIQYGNEETYSPIIGAVYTDEGKLPQMANAHLIAAAPELLATLKEAEQRIIALSPSGYVAPELWAISQAIAKADGRG